MSGNQPLSSPRYMSVPWLFAFVAALCVAAALAGALATEFGGTAGLVIWFVGWCVIFACTWFVTHKYANPRIPIICGAVVGLTFPRPSDEWFQQLVGARWGNGVSLLIGVISVVIGLAIFNAIAKKHHT